MVLKTFPNLGNLYSADHVLFEGLRKLRRSARGRSGRRIVKTARWEQLQGGGSVFGLLGVLLLVLALGLFVIPALSGDGSKSGDVTSTESAESARDKVIAFWEDRAGTHPDDFVAQNKLALAYIQRARDTGDVTDYTLAQTAVDASLSAVPEDNYDALMLLGSLQVTRREFALALETARSAMLLDASATLANAIAGDALIGLGDYDAALETYRELVELSPGLTSFSRLAHIHELRGDAPAAEAAWQDAFNTDDGRRPENTAWARVDYGHYLFRQGNLAGAVEQYQAALGVFPGYLHALAGRARVAAASGLYDEAIPLYEQVVDRQQVLEYVAALGDVYLATGREADAQRQYDLVATIDSLYRETGMNTDVQMALFLADHNLRLEEAVDQAFGGYETHPNNIYAADALSWALHKTEQDEEALTYSEQAVRLGSHDPALLFHAGMVNFRAGNHETARGYLQRVIDTNPKFSLLYASEAAATLEELNKLVSH
jgi:tetratricopeptide (TPR) repeat protein